jgi:hypothetical protein
MAVKVVNLPVAAVTAPIVALLIVPPVTVIAEVDIVAEVIDPPVIVGEVNDLLVSVSVVFLATNVSAVPDGIV